MAARNRNPRLPKRLRRLNLRLLHKLMASDTFDLSRFRAREAEEDRLEEVKYFHVYLGDSKDEEGNLVKDNVRIPQLRKWSIKSQDAFANGKIVEGIRLLVTEEESKLFDEYNWTFGEFEALFDALSNWSGFQTGQPSVKPPARGLTLKSN
jgi:hypothetical protein